MPITRATVTMNRLSAKPEDAVVNVWHLQHLLPLDVSHANKAMFGILSFYEALSLYIGASISRGPVNRIQLSTLTPGGPGPGDDASSVTEWESAWALPLAASGTVPLPSEVAVCLSFRGDLEGVPEETGATRPASRRRGRLYFGPLQAIGSVIDEAPTNLRPKVSSFLQSTMVNAYLDAVEYLNSLTGPFGTADVIRHIIYSPTSGLTHTVQACWVNDNFDTMRSRGEEASAHIETAVVQPAI